MIDRKLKITLGGLPQKIHIKSLDKKNPVLLFLHGGPGICNRHLILINHQDLLDSFTLVGWDQRGTGGSYQGAEKESLTIDRLTRDAAELTEWLCKEFHKDKIFVIGGSWGSLLGTTLACRFPEHIAAYVGFGQMVNGTKNEELSYNFALEEAEKAGDKKSVRALKKLGPPVKGCYKGGYQGMLVQRRVMMKYGGYSRNKAKRGYVSALIKPLVCSGEYSLSDLWGVLWGHASVLKKMWPEVGAFDLAAACPEIRVPYFIFDGRLDQNTPAALVQEFFNELKAPKKELIWFENSGHNPMSDEPEKFKSLLRQCLLEIAKEEENV